MACSWHSNNWITQYQCNKPKPNFLQAGRPSYHASVSEHWMKVIRHKSKINSFQCFESHRASSLHNISHPHHPKVLWKTFKGLSWTWSDLQIKRQVKQTQSSSKKQNLKRRSERCKHCALAVVRRSQKFRPTADPLPRGAGRPNFNQLEMVTTFT